VDPAHGHVRTSTTVAGDKSVVGGKSMARSPSLCFQGLLSHDRQATIRGGRERAVGRGHTSLPVRKCPRRIREGTSLAPVDFVCNLGKQETRRTPPRRSGFSSGGVGCSEEDLRVASVVWNKKWGLLRSDRGSMTKHRSQKGLFVLWLLSFPASRKGLPSDWAREGLPMGWPLTWACDGGRRARAPARRVGGGAGAGGGEGHFGHAQGQCAGLG
jgi:hypothetical protein